MSQLHAGLPPAINNSTKPKRSVSFLNHAEVSKDDSVSSSPVYRSSFQPGSRKGYVRKGPVNSDSEDQDDDSVKDDSNDSCSEQEDEAQEVSDQSIYTPSQSLGAKVLMRPGQNYVRKAPANSDTESEEESEESSPLPSATLQAIGAIKNDDKSGSDSEHDEKDINTLVSPFSHTRIAGPGQNYVRKAPVDSDVESDEEAGNPPNGTTLPESRPRLKVMDTQADSQIVHNQGQGQQSRTPSYETNPGIPMSTTFLSTSPAPGGGHLSPAIRNISPAQTPTGSPRSVLHASSIGMGLGNSSNSSIDNSATASIVNSMAIYQQQQQEMMMIMQQQQMQIAAMQQQQQAYQLLVLQQQQQHQQQLQAAQLQHSRVSSTNDSLQAAVENSDDDDVPLADKKQQLAQALPLSALTGSQPDTPPPLHQQPILGAVPSAHLSPAIQPSILSLPLSMSHPYSPIHSRQTSATSMFSPSSVINSPQQAVSQSHLQPMIPSPLNPASFSPLVQQQQLLHPHQHHQYPSSLTHQQPRLADFIEEEQERLRMEQPQQGDQLSTVGGTQMLTSGFPSSYRNSITSVSPGQLNLERGSNGLNSGGAGVKARSSLMPHQQVLLPSSSPVQPYAASFHPPLVHQPLIHVESKPPPPQTGLVGAISAMERERKFAKAHGTNQLQFQHQQQQQQMMINADKERWLQEQRRQAWESEQMQLPQQQQHILQQQFQPLPQQQQQQQQQQAPFVPLDVPATPLWTVEDEEDDDRPLGSTQ
ncbi:hypothetical protein BGZ46_005431 [Entomortierella lignicola]|nr:hypothetical protein BGZ46_005431 [Entomortierella lignicola]